MHEPLSFSVYGPKGLHSLTHPLKPSPFPRPLPPAQTVRSAQRSTDGGPLLPQDISSRFGVRLRELRRARQMTQLSMAVNFGIDRSFISDVERGRKSISLTFLEVIALGFKLELAELLRGL